jgi:hypothetical protein
MHGLRKLLFVVFIALLIATLAFIGKYDEIVNDAIKFITGAFLFGNVASKVAPALSSLKISKT